MKKLIFAVAVLVMAGCATVETRGNNGRADSCNPAYGPIYPATSYDTTQINYHKTSFVFDLPFSILTDTLFLPFDFFHCKKLW